MRKGLLNTALLLSLLSGGAAAQTVYVHDQLRLGVRAAPDPAEKSIAVVKTGDALKVLGEQDNFIHIQTATGLEGWVSKGYVSSEPPAKNLLEVARQELEVLKQKQGPLQQQLTEVEQKAARQQQQLSQLKSENEALQQQLGLIEEKAGPHPAIIGRVLLLGGLLTGLIIGARWKARRVAERIGGLEI